MDIVHAVLVDFKMVKDVAKQYRVSTITVGQLIIKARKKPKFIGELFAKESIKQQKYDIIEDVVQELNEKDHFIDSASSVIKQVVQN